jgi:GT2 family glycosyltransferase
MKISIIIPYKIDRGWLKEAVASVPPEVELILSQGDGNWPQNFNKGLKKATGDLIKFLHEDDMLTPNSIQDSIDCFSHMDVDFIHGNVFEMYMNAGRKLGIYKPCLHTPTLQDLLKKNVLHSATLMYRREVFEKLGGFNESDKMYSFEELEFNLRVLQAGFKIGYVNQPLAIYRRHPKQIIRTCNIQERKQNRQELINKYL